MLAQLNMDYQLIQQVAYQPQLGKQSFDHRRSNKALMTFQ